MPKRKRVWYPGAVYHIMSRGNRRSKIFRDDSDYHVYLKILDKTGFDYRFQLYGYCLMPNHIHLQLETGETEIWEIMRRINRGYACYFNRRYNLVGHLFQGRYKSRLIQDPLYNLQVNRYIHLNPVKGGLVERPEDYPWSSYNHYLARGGSELVNPGKILQYFWPDNSRDPAGTSEELAAPDDTAASAIPAGLASLAASDGSVSPAASETSAKPAESAPLSAAAAASDTPVKPAEPSAPSAPSAPAEPSAPTFPDAEAGGRTAPHYPAYNDRDNARLKLARKAYQNYIESEPSKDESGIDAEIEKGLI